MEMTGEGKILKNVIHIGYRKAAPARRRSESTRACLCCCAFILGVVLTLMVGILPALADVPPVDFLPAVNYGVSGGPNSVAVGDFNSDGVPDQGRKLNRNKAAFFAPLIYLVSSSWMWL